MHKQSVSSSESEYSNGICIYDLPGRLWDVYEKLVERCAIQLDRFVCSVKILGPFHKLGS